MHDERLQVGVAVGLKLGDILLSKSSLVYGSSGQTWEYRSLEAGGSRTGRWKTNTRRRSYDPERRLIGRREERRKKREDGKVFGQKRGGSGKRQVFRVNIRSEEDCFATLALRPPYVPMPVS